jgi:hypothetical protein
LVHGERVRPRGKVDRDLPNKQAILEHAVQRRTRGDAPSAPEGAVVRAGSDLGQLVSQRDDGPSASHLRDHRQPRRCGQRGVRGNRASARAIKLSGVAPTKIRAYCDLIVDGVQGAALGAAAAARSAPTTTDRCRTFTIGINVTLAGIRSHTAPPR